jgi:MYXO-CTERM domain-containing protein
VTVVDSATRGVERRGRAGCNVAPSGRAAGGWPVLAILVALALRRRILSAVGGDLRTPAPRFMAHVRRRLGLAV